MIIALLREQITLKDVRNVKTGKFWTEANTEWSLRKIYRSLKSKEASEAEEASEQAEDDNDFSGGE
jgi:NDP-sugar pyrophosphorylase family protein